MLGGQPLFVTTWAVLENDREKRRRGNDRKKTDHTKDHKKNKHRKTSFSPSFTVVSYQIKNNTHASVSNTEAVVTHQFHVLQKAEKW